MDGVKKLLRAKVSADKRRFQEGNYDLDLSYVTDRIIGMAFPSEGIEKAFRNDIDDVARLLEERHSGHYMLYNLAAPRAYDYRKFHNKVRGNTLNLFR